MTRKNQAAQAASKAAEPATVEGNIAGVVNDEGQAVALVDMPEDELHQLAADMGIEIAGKSKEEIAAAIAAEPVTADAAEPDAPEGVATVEDDTAPEQQAEATGFAAAWHVKAGGKLYQPGDEFPADLVSDELLAGGAVVKA